MNNEYVSGFFWDSVYNLDHKIGKKVQYFFILLHMGPPYDLISIFDAKLILRNNKDSPYKMGIFFVNFF